MEGKDDCKLFPNSKTPPKKKKKSLFANSEYLEALQMLQRMVKKRAVLFSRILSHLLIA